MFAPPYSHEQINAAAASISPSTLQISNTWICGYFRRYLLQEAMSVFSWKIPDNWSLRYLLYILYCYGYVAVINTDAFGVIPQYATLKGRNVFYEPTHAVITNPAFRDVQTPQIGRQTALIQLTPDYRGILDIVNYYAEIMALTAQAVQMNLANSKFSYIFGTKDKTAAQTLKKMFDTVMRGETAVFTGATLRDENGNPTVELFNNNLKANYIADSLMVDLRKIKAEFDREVGIPSANTEKRERMVTDEVTAANAETFSKSDLWYTCLTRSIDKVKNLFDIDLSIERRFQLVPAGDTFNTGAL